jgi:predicted glycoside hydrolase/deacetylase ChbG (UPF0249 family)
MKRLIVNADDFGLCAGVNAAIVAVHRAGSLSSTTLLVNGAAAAEAAALARAHPQLGVGLHFNLTLGRPSAPPGEVPDLLDGDAFMPRSRLARRLLAGRVPRAQIARELAAQQAAFASLGLTPTHMDSHQHVHGFAPVFDVMAAACSAAGLPLRQPWVHALPDARAGLARRLRQLLLQRMNRRNARRWEGRLRSNRDFVSVFDLGALPTPIEAQHYTRLLAAAQSPCELMVHLSQHASDVDGLTRIGAVSTAEYRALAAGALGEAVRTQGWQLASYRDAFAPEPA